MKKQKKKHFVPEISARFTCTSVHVAKQNNNKRHDSVWLWYSVFKQSKERVTYVTDYSVNDASGKKQSRVDFMAFDASAKGASEKF